MAILIFLLVNLYIDVSKRPVGGYVQDFEISIKHKLIKELDWGTLYPDLIRFANYIIRTRFWYNGKENLPHGMQAEDLVQNVIYKIIAEIRNWNYTKEPDIKIFIQKEIFKRAFQLLETADLKRRIRPVDFTEFMDLNSNAHNKNTPIDIIISEEIYRFLLDHLGNDPLQKEIINCLLMGMKRREIAEILDLHLNEYDNRLKRIKRAYNKFLRETKGNN